MKRKNRFLGKLLHFLGPLVLAWAPAILLYELLDAQGSREDLLAYGFLLTLFVYRSHRSILYRVLAVITAVVGLVIISAILSVIPLDALANWHGLARAGMASGFLSYLVVFIVTLICALVASSIYTYGYLYPSLVLVTILSLVMGSLTLQWFWFLPGLAALASLLVMLPGTDNYGGKVGRGIRLAFSQFFLTLVAGIPLVLLTAGQTSPPPPLFESLRRAMRSQFREYIQPTQGNYGFSEDEDLGIESPPRPIRQPLFRLEAPGGRAYYLRNQSLEFFSGARWVNRSSYREETPALLEVLEGTPPEGARVDGWLEVTGDLITYINHPFDARRIWVPRERLLAMGFSLEGSSGTVQLPLQSAIRSRTALARGQRMAFQLTGPEDPLPSRTMPPEEREVYTQLPGTYPQAMDQVVEEAREAWQESREQSGLPTDGPLAPDGAQASFLLNHFRNHLRDNYEYVLAAPIGQGNMLERFFVHDKIGYSLHFASSFITLARLAGIPARFVTGLFVPLAPGTDSGEASTLNLHAWAEVFLDGRWELWESTPPLMDGAYLSPDFWARGNYDEATRANLAGLLENLGTAPESVVVEGFREWLARWWMTLTALGFLGALLLGTLGRKLSQERQIKKRDAVFLSSTLQPRERHLLSSILRLTRRQTDLPLPERHGWISWFEALEERTLLKEEESLALQEILLERIYGNGPALLPGPWKELKARIARPDRKFRKLA